MSENALSVTCTCDMLLCGTSFPRRTNRKLNVLLVERVFLAQPLWVQSQCRHCHWMLADVIVLSHRIKELEPTKDVPKSHQAGDPGGHWCIVPCLKLASHLLAIQIRNEHWGGRGHAIAVAPALQGRVCHLRVVQLELPPRRRLSWRT